MQRRFYYVLDTLDATVRLAKACESQGVANDQIHVLAKNDDGLVRHNIKTGTPLQVYDVIHLGSEGAIIGSIIGLAVAIGIWLWNPFEPDIKFWMVIPVWVLFTLHGAWSGGLIGTHARNYRIKPFLKPIENGKYLTMIDINEDQLSAIKKVEREQQVVPAGNSPTGSNPFENWLSFRVTQSEWPKVKR